MFEYFKVQHHQHHYKGTYGEESERQDSLRHIFHQWKFTVAPTNSEFKSGLSLVKDSSSSTFVGVKLVMAEKMKSGKGKCNIQYLYLNYTYFLKKEINQI